MKLATALAGVVAAATLIGSANAADIARPVYKEPVVVPSFSWTGLYIGAVAGYGWGDADLSNGIIGAFGTARTKPDGWLAGGTIGYNYQQGNLVLGTEGEFYWSNLDGSATNVTLGVPLTGTYSNNWTGTVSTRLGVAFDTVLIYGKAGIAWANNEYTLSSPLLGVGVFSSSETETGWLIGSGIEWAFARNWSAKIEGTYIDYGARSRDYGVAIGGFPISATIDAHVSTVKFGVNYRFY